MRAAHISRLEGPDAVEIVDAPAPQASATQVLIEVAAAGVAYPDVLLTRGDYQIKPDPPFIPGGEVAGVVASAPPGSGFTVGQRVAGFPFLGGFAEQVAVEEAMVFPLPDTLSFEQGAALPMNYLTCHFALTQRGAVQPGEKVLIHGAAGGIGTAAIQLAKAMGAQVYAVVSTPQKGDVARQAGADEVLLSDSFLAQAKDLTQGRGVDVVLDPVGGDRFTDSLRALAPLGRLLVVGFTGGAIPEVKVNRLLLSNTSVVGVGWGAYWLAHGASYLRRQWEAITPWLQSGAIDPPIGMVRDLDEVSAAIRDLDERRATGKVILQIRR